MNNDDLRQFIAQSLNAAFYHAVHELCVTGVLKEFTLEMVRLNFMEISEPCFLAVAKARAAYVEDELTRLEKPADSGKSAGYNK